MSKTKITLYKTETSVEAGFTKVSDFYEQLKISPSQKRLYLDRSGDIDIPLFPDDHVVIHGGEKIVVGDIDDQIGDNPRVRTPITITFNGKKIEAGFEQARVRSDEICQRDTELESARLFLDLSGDVDISIKDGLTLVIQAEDSFFTIPSGDGDSIDLEKCAKNGRKPPKGQHYRLTIDREKYEVKQQELNGKRNFGVGRKELRYKHPQPEAPWRTTEAD